MTKAELVEHVTIIVQLPKRQVGAVLTRCSQGIMDVVYKGNTIELRGFGRFGSVIAQRIQDTTHARGTFSRCRPELCQRSPWGKPSKRWCNPYSTLTLCR